nr:disease resistance protein At4g27190-like isoform X1 [Ziziphus jujuba var. spinosa]XP_048333949.1 disease resistance protein At4g27190-like isoform X1 [Ziziphus jujuba var. spinosa]
MDQIKRIADCIVTIAECPLKPIIHQVCYVVQYKSNIEDLQTRVDKLNSLTGRVQHSVDKGERTNEKAEDDVKKWIENVGKVIEKANKFSEEANEFVEEEHQANKKCLHGFCANLKPRHQLGRKSTKIKEEVVKLHTEGEKYTTQAVSYPPPLQETWNTSTTSEAFQSRSSIVDRIIKDLAKPDINIIGVYGLGGVGKTTLVKQVSDLVQQKHFFDEVAMATVSENPDPKRIQGEIADKLDLKFQQETTAGRALNLKERTRNKKILIILDDIWTKLDLEVVGLEPIGGCKILATSRTREALSETGTRNEFKLEVLHERESWILFEKKAGDVVKDPTIKNIAVEVAKRCSGLPVLIISVASSLRSKKKYSWEDALESLKKIGRNEMQKKSYSILEWSYNQLRDNEAKSFFLLCAMVAVRNEVSLKDLLIYSFGLGILRNMDTLEKARNRLYSLVDYLKDSCLLLDGDDDQYPKIHDIVRDAALWIVRKEHQVLSVTSGSELKEWPEKDLLEHCPMIYFGFHSTFHARLPAKLQCPKLKLFILVNNDDEPLEVPENFFEEMKELKVLDLTDFGNLLLPPSFVSLTNLQTLCLVSCAFADDDDVLGKIGELRGLQILSLARSNVGKLCKEIGQLTCLRLLDLSHCFKLKVIPPNVLSNLSRLEELNMERSFKNWEAEGVTDERRINASVSELKHLSQLTTLNVSVENADALPTNLFSDKLERFQINVGGEDVLRDYLDNETSKKLRLKLTRSDQLDQSVKMLIRKSESLYLDLVEGVSNCIPQLDSEGFPQLKLLEFQNHASEMKHIVESINCTHSAFPSLESLVLFNVSSVESICYPQLGTDPFGKLRTIRAHWCSGLKNLLPLSMVNCFLKLQEMELSHCDILEKVFVAEKEKGDEIFIRQDMDPTEFCQLQFLTLRNLPQFIGFSSIGGRVDEIHNNSAPLFNRKLKFPKSLEELKMEGLDRITSIWPDYDSKLIKLSATYKQLNSCRNLRIIRVDGCGSLKYVFPASAARGLEQLVELNVTNCRSIKEIIAKEEGDDDADEIIKFVFPKVKKLRLRYLPQLGNFYPGMHTSKWPSLTSMEINKCKKVETLASDISTFHHQHDQTTTNPNPLFFIEKGSFPKLESLEVTAEEYLCDPLLTHAESFPRLKEVNLFCMHVKSAVFPFASLLKLPALQDLKLQSAFFKEIFMVEQASGLVNGGLTNLGLWRLPELMRLWDENLLALQHQVAAHLVFPNMENLWVKECRRLKDVVQFAISFPNLKALELYECDELNYLFTYSVATSLTKLESLVIKYCKRMTEIISVPSTSNGDDDEYDQTITFGRLELLELHDLPCLAGFCSGNSINVKVPFLQHLKVTNCGLEMKISPDEILVINDSKSAERSLHIAEEEEEDEEDDDYIVYESI